LAEPPGLLSSRNTMMQPRRTPVSLRRTLPLNRPFPWIS
jgi:hypothetical protein